MDDWSFKESDIINARDRFIVPKRMEPPVDEIVSDIVGFKVYSVDPRLIQLIMKWKKLKGSKDTVNSSDPMPNNFLNNPAFIAELKQVFIKPL